jgi:peptidoglycan hydrolase-like protein with peptidoglycan-binding domain
VKNKIVFAVVIVFFFSLFVSINKVSACNIYNASGSGIEQEQIENCLIQQRQQNQYARDEAQQQPTFNTDLKYGSKGQAVLDLQNFLQNQGVLTVKPNGYFGPNTLKAVRSFQLTNELPTTGFFGPLSRAIASKMFIPNVSAISNSAPVVALNLPSTLKPIVPPTSTPNPSPIPTPNPIPVLTFCQTHPTDSTCVPKTFCQLHPTDPSCITPAPTPTPPAPTCTDGIQNGNETGVDCGGSCTACPVPPAPVPTVTAQSTGNPTIKLPQGDWDSTSDVSHILNTGKQQLATFQIWSTDSTIAWKQITMHVSMSPGLTASNWIINDNSNTAYTSDVSIVQNGDTVTFTAPNDMPIYNTDSGVEYSVYATISGNVTPTSTISTWLADNSDFVWNGSYTVGGLPTVPQTRYGSSQ